MNREELLKTAKPILFNTDMVRAVLDDRKMDTRRVIKPANPFRNKEGYCQGNGLWIDGYNKNDEPNGHIKDYSVSSCWIPKKSYIDKYAPYKKGSVLYVRETFRPLSSHPGAWFEYAADWSPKYFDNSRDSKAGNGGRWKPSIHMPKRAARIFLKVTDVKVRRLQDMTLDDFLSEGVVIRPEAFNDPDNAYLQAREIFKKIWDKTASAVKYNWACNPWVWVIRFERIYPEGEEL